MTNQEAIKYLQQLYPNGGHCWLDEQRIEAISMAVKNLQEEPVSNPIDFEKELYKAFGQVKDFTLGMRIAKWFYDMGKNSQEPVSEELLKELKGIVNIRECVAQGVPVIKIARHFTNLQKAKDESVTKDLGDYINELSKQFPEVSFAKLSRIAVRVAKWQKLYDMGITERKAQNTIQDILEKGDELEAFATEIAFKMFPANLQEPYHDMHRGRIVDAVMYGAEWQKQHLWKPADGDDLPEYEREVVVFTQDFPNDAGIMSVAIGHRPNPNGWDGKSIATGKVEHYTPKTYDKGGWNIPDIKWWLDCLLPNMKEE